MGSGHQYFLESISEEEEGPLLLKLPGAQAGIED